MQKDMLLWRSFFRACGLGLPTKIWRTHASERSAMQLTLVRPAGLCLRPASLGGRTGLPEEDRLHAEPSERAEGVGIRPISRDSESIERIGLLYFRSYPDGEVGTCEEAVADVEATSAGEYGAWIPDACLVAEEGGEPVGAILVTDNPPWDDVEDLTFIVDLFVAPDKRGRGIADALVGAALAAVGGREVGLRVESENAAARRIYERHGFAMR